MRLVLPFNRAGHQIAAERNPRIGSENLVHPRDRPLLADLFHVVLFGEHTLNREEGFQ